MRRLIGAGLAAAALAGTCATMALAHEARNACDLRTLRGTYVFTASGFAVNGGVIVPKLDVGQIGGAPGLMIVRPRLALPRVAPGRRWLLYPGRRLHGHCHIRRCRARGLRYRRVAQGRHDLDDSDESGRGVSGNGAPRRAGGSRGLNSQARAAGGKGERPPTTNGRERTRPLRHRPKRCGLRRSCVGRTAGARGTRRSQ